MALLNPEHLLEQAEHLVKPSGSGAPRQADLRRAISNAYYAIFHTILAGTADHFVGSQQRTKPRYELVYRSITHASLRSLCEEAIKNTPKPKYFKYFPTGGFGSDLFAVAAAVVELQEKRHSADYDPLFRVKMLDAQLAVETGRAAVSRFTKANPTSRKAFLLLLVFPPKDRS